MGAAPKLPGGPWFTGARIRIQVPQPLQYTLSSTYRGTPKAFYGPGVPLIRNDLLGALREAGVDNFELFDAVVKDPVTGQELHDYKAFNVLGLVAAADMDKSRRAPINPDSEMIDVFFDSLVIDPSKSQGLLMFRLAQSVNAIIVHEQVKQAVEKRGIPGMVFYKPEDWSG
ncbi:imm11 family protein [Pyxidicoccus parkwayensis]|uniref:imm11 family protein n=1 Tax=Pyxidicoccus parkwayensis TaxID=2813578 RepID=UPI00353161EF